MQGLVFSSGANDEGVIGARHASPLWVINPSPRIIIGH
jgi:hypothetical protein